jgi:hypothetical protein
MAEENTPNEPTPEVTPDPLLLVDDSTKQFFEQYVGPGKKYANIGELAKGYANADQHLSEVTRDAGIFKTEAESLKELLMENLVTPKPNEADPNTPPNEAEPLATPPAGTPPKETDVDLKALVKEALGEVSSEEKRQSNARTTEEATVKKFGSKEDAVKAIEAKANELGVSAQWIADQAFTSPKAYFTIMGFTPDETPKSSNTPASQSDVNPARLADAHPGGPRPNSYQWFMDVRRTDPSRFRSREFQTQMMKAAEENPDFYKN